MMHPEVGRGWQRHHAFFAYHIPAVPKLYPLYHDVNVTIQVLRTCQRSYSHYVLKTSSSKRLNEENLNHCLLKLSPSALFAEIFFPTVLYLTSEPLMSSSTIPAPQIVLLYLQMQNCMPKKLMRSAHNHSNVGLYVNKTDEIMHIMWRVEHP